MAAEPIRDRSGQTMTPPTRKRCAFGKTISQAQLWERVVAIAPSPAPARTDCRTRRPTPAGCQFGSGPAPSDPSQGLGVWEEKVKWVI